MDTQDDGARMKILHTRSIFRRNGPKTSKTTPKNCTTAPTIWKSVQFESMPHTARLRASDTSTHEAKHHNGRSRAV